VKNRYRLIIEQEFSNRLLLPSLLLLAYAFLWASQAFADPPPAYEGRRLFVSYCQLCHGPGGKGNGPLAREMGITPADLTTTVRSRSDTILRKIITGEGRQTITGRDRHNLLSENMPEWKDVFSDDQVTALIAYLRFLSTSKHGLMGDPEVGMRLYGKYCQVCHGEEGEGDGIMTRIMRMNPMDHTNPNETGRLDNRQIVTSILDGKGRYMPAWRDILSQQDAEGLVSYIRLLSQ
jgi:cbb3-type cytochrome c oxidase subunit III